MNDVFYERDRALALFYSMAQALHYVAHRGKWVYVGLVKDEIHFLDPNFHKKELTLMGSRNATHEGCEYVLRLLLSGYMNATNYITHRCGFDEVIDVFETFFYRKQGCILFFTL
jgi:threonine dehydrogenase-like Zn-dependent dehydrogenase